MPAQTTLAIIQARVGSTRLPNKVLMDLNGQTVLRHVLQRCQTINGVDGVVCALPDSPENDPVAVEATASGAAVFRGSENDVLDRYYQAARENGADVILRVTSDCPLIDPAVCSHVISQRAQSDADYACNNIPPLFPHGLDCEVFRFTTLEQAAKQAREPVEREHVTPWMRKHQNLRHAYVRHEGGDLHTHRWTLDFPEDMDFLRALATVMGDNFQRADFHQVLDVLERHPEISAINAQHAVFNPNDARNV